MDDLLIKDTSFIDFLGNLIAVKEVFPDIFRPNIITFDPNNESNRGTLKNYENYLIIEHQQLLQQEKEKEKEEGESESFSSLDIDKIYYI